MDSVALILRAVLFIVFAIAGGAKLADLQASSDTVTAFGVPAGPARALGRLLPVAELVTALALLPTATARWGAVAAGVLLVVFNGGIAYALSQGRTPDCNCFGQVSSEQISSRTLLRNAALLVLAGVSIWRGAGSSLSHWTANLTAADLTAAVALLGLALAVITIMSLRQLLGTARLELASAGAPPAPKPGLAPGEIAPPFELPSLTGKTTASLTELLDRGAPALLVFASQGCGPCRQLLPELVRWSETLEERLAIVLIESGVQDAEGLAEEIASHGTILTLLDDGRETAVDYQIEFTPSAVVVDVDGRIASRPTAGGPNIEALVRATLEESAKPQRTVTA